MTEPVEVRQVSPLYRTFIVLAWIGIAAFFEWIAYRNSGPGHWIGYVMAGVSFWVALYWLRAPGVIARADDTGITFADTRLGLFFVYGAGRAAWTDVLGVDTRHRTTRAGTYLRSRITVRGEGGTGKRKFTLTSRCAGYAAFMEAVHARTGFPVGPAPDSRTKMLVMVAVWFALIGVALALFLHHR